MTSVYAKLLGIPIVKKDTEEITFPYAKAEALFYYMLVKKRASRDVLVDLFWSNITLSAAGDAKRLQPHLDMVTGCVEVKYKGNKKSMGLKYELWENGEMKGANDTTSRFIKDNEFDGTISISLKEDIREENKCRMKIFISDD